MAQAGTLLIREWQGAAHRVTMLGDGVSFRGKSYRSLSEVAREITGSRWCQTHGRRLRRDSVSFAETIGQAIANIAPTLTPAIMKAGSCLRRIADISCLLTRRSAGILRSRIHLAS
jgi:alkylhydroperoxidase family enzyme